MPSVTSPTYIWDVSVRDRSFEQEILSGLSHSPRRLRVTSTLRGQRPRTLSPIMPDRGPGARLLDQVLDPWPYRQSCPIVRPSLRRVRAFKPPQ
jgi:hypothetical protein